MGSAVVLDTNILISSIFWQKGKSHKIVELAIEQKINNFVSPDILNELVKVLRIDFKQPEEFVQKQLILVKSYSNTVIPKIKVKAVIENSKDDMVLECALSCKAQYIVTGDKHLLNLKEFKDIKIVTPKEFLTLIK